MKTMKKKGGGDEIWAIPQDTCYIKMHPVPKWPERKSQSHPPHMRYTHLKVGMNMGYTPLSLGSVGYRNYNFWATLYLLHCCPAHPTVQSNSHPRTPVHHMIIFRYILDGVTTRRQKDALSSLPHKHPPTPPPLPHLRTHRRPRMHCLGCYQPPAALGRGPALSRLCVPDSRAASGPGAYVGARAYDAAFITGEHLPLGRH